MTDDFLNIRRVKQKDLQTLRYIKSSVRHYRVQIFF